MDGALSNNMPLFEHRNTITMAPFSGESDICPKEGTFNFFEVHYGNVSIQVNTGNVHRVYTSFLPPRLEVSPCPSFFYFKPWWEVTKYTLVLYLRYFTCAGMPLLHYIYLIRLVSF